MSSRPAQPVSVTARVPRRGGLAVLAVVLLGAAARVLAEAWQPLPPEPAPLSFDPSFCQGRFDAEACRAVMPTELAALPTVEQYRRRREAELVLRGRAEGAELEVERGQLQQRLLTLLMEIDPWVRAEVQDPASSLSALRGLARVAGWDEPPEVPLLELSQPGGASDQELARAAALVVGERLDSFVRAREQLLWEPWTERFLREGELQDALARRELRQGGGAALLGLGLLAAFAWAWLRPMQIRADGRELHGGRLWPWVLSAEDAAALDRASAQAHERGPSDAVEISAAEVRVIASFPYRGLLGRGAAAALCAAALLGIASAWPLPPVPAAPTLRASECQEWDEACYEQLPHELRQVPSDEQYGAWLESSLAGLTIVPAEPELYSPLEREEILRAAREATLVDREAARSRLLAALAEGDPWVRAQRDARGELAQPPPGPSEQASALVALADLRDWSGKIVVPPPPDLSALGGPTSGWGAAIERRRVDLYVVGHRLAGQLLSRYVRERQRQLSLAWSQAELALQEQHAQAQEAHERAHTRRWQLGGLAAVALALGTLGALGWRWLRPLHLHADLHALRWRGRRLAWTEIEGLSCSHGVVTISGQGSSQWLGPWVLPPEAAAALLEAGERARELAAALSPQDGQARSRGQRHRVRDPAG
jgi:hypothetical protein